MSLYFFVHCSPGERGHKINKKLKTNGSILNKIRKGKWLCWLHVMPYLLVIYSVMYYNLKALAAFCSTFQQDFDITYIVLFCGEHFW